MPASVRVMLWAVLFLPASADTEVTCAECHPKQAAHRLGMGRSFRPAEALPAASFRHRRSRSRLEVRGTSHTVNGRSEQISYVIGSGKAGSSYLVERNGALYQSPLSWFSGRGWDVSPGFEADRELDFTRPVAEECLFCHAGAASHLRGSLNRFENPPAPLDGIPCERCHGPGDRHAADPKRDNIVNPQRLSGALRDAVCDQCHLSGEARVLNPGKRWQDYQPGTALEDTFTTYVRDSAATGLHVVSHVEQLAGSKCFRLSEGRMSCGTCHQVHAEAPGDPNRACLGCHVSLPQRHTGGRDCAGCHMPRRRTFDGGHTAFTDHRIARIPEKSHVNPPAPASLRPWRASIHDSRNLGLALAAAADRWRSNALLDAAFSNLAPRRAEFARDAEVQGALGYMLLRAGKAADAVPLLTAAVRQAPREVRFRLNLGLALAADGKKNEARSALHELLVLDPKVEAARAALDQLR